MKIALTFVALALAGCATATPVAAPTPSATSSNTPVAAPTPSVAVLGTKLTAKPKPVVKTKPKPRLAPAKAWTAPKKKKATPGVCYVGKPCNLTGLHWTKTVGCTKAWLAAQRRFNPAAQCPPGWPYLG
jgi:hypothetical protein